MPYLLRRGLLVLILLVLYSPVQAQENPTAEAASAQSSPRDEWFWGTVFRRDGLGYDPTLRQALGGENLLGLQMQHRMDPWFSSGASLLFSQEDNALVLSLDGRWYWPLSLAEPYLGLELNYLTRNNGGVSATLRPGVQLRLLPQFQLDGFGLLRYDLFDVLFATSNSDVSLYMGLGLALLWRIGP